MLPKSPSDRLPKLFHKRDDVTPRPDISSSASSPLAPSSATTNRLQGRHSRNSLHEIAREVGDLARTVSGARPRRGSASGMPSSALQDAAHAASKGAHSGSNMEPLPTAHQTDLTTDVSKLAIFDPLDAEVDLGLDLDPKYRRNEPRKRESNVADAGSSNSYSHVAKRKPVPARDVGNQKTPDRSIIHSSRPVTGGPKEVPRIAHRSLDKPLPSSPSSGLKAGMIAEAEDDPGVDSELGRDRGYLARDAEHPIDLKDAVDLSNTEDTSLHEQWTPAVTHETITQEVHEIREEQITREIHNHHVFHRILPIVDVEVLPTRHFMPVEGGYAEISEDEVPGRAGSNAQWLITETVSKLMPKSEKPTQPPQFSARKFEGTEGDRREYITPQGFKRTETWWVHPPTIETGAQETGQSYEFHFDSSDPAKDGLQAKLPLGQVVGVSPLLAKQQRERMESNEVRAHKVDETPPPVPPHKIFPA